MTKYNFQTPEFAVSDSGIHLLRSGFNYKTIAFSEISSIKVEKGKELNNWVLVFALGLALVLVGMYFSLGAISVLLSGDFRPRQARLIFLLLIPAAGAYFIYNAFQTGLVLKINYANKKKDMFPLKEIVKENNFQNFMSFLNAKLNSGIQFTE